MKRVAVMLAALVIAIVLLVATSAAEAEQDAIATDSDTTASAASTKDNAKEALSATSGVRLIPDVRQQGYAAYENSFASIVVYGRKLDIELTNNGSSAVAFNVKINGVDMETVHVPARTARTRAFIEMFASGLSGQFNEYVYTTDGSYMDVSVSARQYEADAKL